jgi:adenylate kinase family enzyme
MQRISVVGTSGSGKTTLARDISLRLNIPHVELDYIVWGRADTNTARLSNLRSLKPL